MHLYLFSSVSHPNTHTHTNTCRRNACRADSLNAQLTRRGGQPSLHTHKHTLTHTRMRALARPNETCSTRPDNQPYRKSSETHATPHHTTSSRGDVDAVIAAAAAASSLRLPSSHRIYAHTHTCFSYFNCQPVLESQRVACATVCFVGCFSPVLMMMGMCVSHSRKPPPRHSGCTCTCTFALPEIQSE